MKTTLKEKPGPEFYEYEKLMRAIGINLNQVARVATGIEWFKSRGQWQGKGYSPRPGDIIFFDWEVDGKPNHVGIVEKTEDGYIYTVEGNSADDGCRAKKYSITSNVIYGFGLPAY